MATELSASESAPKVFATFELLEMILIDTLDPDDEWDVSPRTRAEAMRAIFRMPRVNSTFRDVITRSETLSVAIFKRHQHDENDGDGNSNGFEDDDDAEEHSGLVLNPLLDDLHSCTHTHYASFHATNYVGGLLETDEKHLRGTVIADWMRNNMSGHGTWRELLVANQPIRFSVRAQVFVDRTMRTHVWRDTKVDGDTTLGMLADKIDQWVAGAVRRRASIQTL